MPHTLASRQALARIARIAKARKWLAALIECEADRDEILAAQATLASLSA